MTHQSWLSSLSDGSTSHSSDPNHMEWYTDPPENHSHPNHFNGHGDKDTITTTYSMTYLDYESNKSTYIGGKPATDAPPPFDDRKTLGAVMNQDHQTVNRNLTTKTKV